MKTAIVKSLFLFAIGMVGLQAQVAKPGHCWNERVGWIDMSGVDLEVKTQTLKGIATIVDGHYNGNGFENGEIDFTAQDGTSLKVDISEDKDADNNRAIRGQAFSEQIGWVVADHSANAPAILKPNGELGGNFWSDEFGWIQCDEEAIGSTNGVTNAQIWNLADILVSHKSITVDENGGTGVFSVRLGAAPSSAVVLTLRNGSDQQTNIDTTQLVFNAGNWDQNQTVTITGVDDQGVTWDENDTITLSVDAASSDDAYDALEEKQVLVLLRNDDVRRPAMAPDLVDSSDTGLLHNDDITRDATPTLSVRCTGAMHVLKVYESNTMLAQHTCLGAGDERVTLPARTDGMHIVAYTESIDGVGESPLSDNAWFTVDTVAPSGAILAPEDGAHLNETSPAISGTKEIRNSIEVRDANNALVCSVATNDATTWQCAPVTPLPDGSITIHADVTDVAGNVFHTISGTIYIDTQPPGVPTSVRIEAPVGATVEVGLPADAEAGDVVDFDSDGDGTADWHRVLTDADIQAHIVRITTPDAARIDMELAEVHVAITDRSGNTSPYRSSQLDTDSDGIPNVNDDDDDNDTIADSDERSYHTLRGYDADGDSIPNRLDLDSDNDGLSDAVEYADGGNAVIDTDGDNIPNFLDLDSDGDGLPDTYEGNFEVKDGDNDGIVGTGTPADEDHDGLADTNDPDHVGNVLNGYGYNKDRDNDQTPNYLDTDIDGDGIPDNTEGQPTDADGNITILPSGADVNHNGLDDAYDVKAGGTAIGYVNTDGGSAPDYADDDSDNDGILDTDEGTAENLWRVIADEDGDGVANNTDLDDDNDGILDTDEGNGTLDTDGDGFPDSLDLDSDNDGIPDNIESGDDSDTNHDGHPGDVYDKTAVDGDGLPASLNGTPIDINATAPFDDDADDDGTPNFQDIDSDGDTINDAIEGGGIDPDNDGRQGPGKANDQDADGLPDLVDPYNEVNASKPIGGTPLDLNDTDGDGTPDYLDVDSDNDGISDADEIAAGTDPLDAASNPAASYAEVVEDINGNANAHRVTAAELNSTTGVTNAREGTNYTPALQAATYGDKDHPTAVEIQAVIDAVNAGPDTDGDGIPDSIDTDDDNDGISDADEIAAGTDPLDAASNPAASYAEVVEDINGNANAHRVTAAELNSTTGVTNAREGTNYTPALQAATYGDKAHPTAAEIQAVIDAVNAGPDTDGDGIPDSIDTDDDNDGVSDADEIAAGTDPLDAASNPAASYAEVVEDINGNANAHRVTAAELNSTTGVTNAREGTNYTPALQAATYGDKAHPTAAEIQAVIDAVNAGPDTDGDGIPDSIDTDDDNDGVSDADEIAAGTDPLRVDTDNDGKGDAVEGNYDVDEDGIIDALESCIIDTDHDGVVDELDSDNTSGNNDSDHDGISNADEVAQGTDPLKADSDGDGVNDLQDVFPLDPDEFIDTDGDGTGNNADLDDDGDGFTDAVEANKGTDPLNPDSNPAASYAEVVEDINGNANGHRVTAAELNSIDNVANAQENTDYTPALQAAIYDDKDHPTAAEIQDVIDAVNSRVDTDGDGTIDALDVDDDGDGISDALEESNATLRDVDHDGIPNHLDLDSDNDGLPDAVEYADGGNAVVDTDGDGNPNYLDLDSDGDGLPDTFEGYFTIKDGDNDGIVGTGTPADSDHDGLADVADPDSDAFDAAAAQIGFNKDLDGDGIKNYLDLDIDGDGIEDNIEGQSTFDLIDPYGLDDNHNGLDDAYDVRMGGAAIGYVNTDGGSAPDYADADSDNDGLTDLEEGTAGNAWRTIADEDGDGVANNTDVDDDNDGILDTDEGNGAMDTDGDGIPDSLDLDSDNDGIPDNIESGDTTDTNHDGHPGGNYDKTAVDANGLPTQTPNFLDPNADADGDTQPNRLDLDSDNDGLFDTVEAGGNDANNDGIYGEGKANDADADGLPDEVDPLNEVNASESLGGTPLPLPDTDHDGIPNYLDTDSDNDGLTDEQETRIGTDPYDPLSNPTAFLAEVVEDIHGNANGRRVLSEELNLIEGISGAKHGTDYTPAFQVGTYGDKNHPTVAEIQAVIDAVNAGPDTDGDGIPDSMEREIITASLIGFIWFDNNADGIQDPDEEGVPGVTVSLTDGSGTVIETVRTSNRFAKRQIVRQDLLGKATSSASGIYKFDRLSVRKTYRVKIDLATLPKGYVLTLKGEGDGTNGSDLDAVTGMSDPIAPKAGANTIHVNVGIHYDGATPETPYLIGRYFWVDKDGDNAYDGGNQGIDEPIAGALIELFDAQGRKLYWNDSRKNTLGILPTEYPAETHTTKEGEYSFHVPKGAYRVKFHIPSSLIAKGYYYSNMVDKDGFTQDVEVGPGKKTQALTLDASIGCPCASIQGDSIGAISLFGRLGMMIGVLFLSLFWIRREDS